MKKATLNICYGNRVSVVVRGRERRPHGEGRQSFFNLLNMERIESIIAKLKDHSYQPNPARRVYIAKKNSKKKRPLGIPSTDDRLIQEVVRMILEAIYEPIFSCNSHGFRPIGKSINTMIRYAGRLEKPRKILSLPIRKKMQRHSKKPKKQCCLCHI